MSASRGFPPEIILEGPVFSDELSVSPQQFRQTTEIESLRLVPAKSASSGVHAVYFRPEHRTWALVRLAKRYRWILEIQLNRGLSGEQQLYNQQFTEADRDFLFDIFPRPSHQYNPIVYDMLWLVATYDEYLRLAKALTDVDSFTPRELIDQSPGLNPSDASFLTRFLRHHLISSSKRDQHRNPPQSQTAKATSRLDLDSTYMITEEGVEALDGIVTEYERIFTRGEFEPLLLNPDLDPVKHLREFETDEEVTEAPLSLEEIQAEEGILGEIAESFASVAVGESQAAEYSRPASETETSIRAEPHQPTGHDTTSPDSPINPETDVSLSSQSGSSEQHSSRQTQTRSETNDRKDPVPHDDATSLGAFTREEILNATVVTARLIRSESVARTSTVKATALESISVGNRPPGELWDLVSQALRSMDCIAGRPGGRVWLYIPPADH
ncbi:hypothetical protein [Salinigranum halophilum]|uniref:hypothetical protein n=1 Tax=Salinigranum halophilum TaxID=2565931 RepID=UPI00115DD2B2|nr:hypothetical protein [Salinigranum halophilum]